DACSEPPQGAPVGPVADFSQAALFELQPALGTAAVPDVIEPPSAIVIDVGIATNPWKRMAIELGSAIQTLVSAAVYATLIVTFGFQVARGDGLSMAPTLEDHHRLVVHQLAYELRQPRPGDNDTLHSPLLL